MSTFKGKVQTLKATLNHQTVQEPQIQVIKECKGRQQSELSLQQPIIIERKITQPAQQPPTSQSASNHKSTLHKSTVTSRKKVEPWQPATIPVRDKKIDVENISLNTAPSQGVQKEIDIQIERDDRDKECLKKLFKKVRKLEEQLKISEKERIRLGLELENYSNRSRTCLEHDKTITKLEGENYRLEVDLGMARQLLRQREEEISRLNSRAPKQVIKEVIVEKPVEVQIEVPKIVAGPERIVEKVVEVPKYVEVEKKVPVEVVKEIPTQVVKTVEIPVPKIVEQPVYIEKPIYIDRPVEVQRKVEVPIEVPVQYPVYIDKPVVDEEFMVKYRQMEATLEASGRERAILIGEVEELKRTVLVLRENLDVMRLHNEEKNRSVEYLLQNSADFVPFSPSLHHHQQQEHSLGSVKYSVSSNPHPRVI